jgi:hypothetical protein
LQSAYIDNEQEKMMVKVGEIFAQALRKAVTAEEQIHLDGVANSLETQLVKFASDANRMAEAFGHFVIREVEKIEDDYKRSNLLSLYRRRHVWKKADLSRLQTYPLNKAARHLVAKLQASKRVGRGTTVAYQTIAERLVMMRGFLKELFDPTTLPNRRLYLLKQTRWWPGFVEMTYRGEYLKLKREGGRSPSARAEQAVASICLISTATLKQLCSEVRKEAAAGLPLSGSLEVSDFAIWMETGRLPSDNA